MIVERRALPSDRRVKAVALTPHGVKMKAELMAHFYEPPDALVELDRDALEALREALEKISEPESEPEPAPVA